MDWKEARSSLFRRRSISTANRIELEKFHSCARWRTGGLPIKATACALGDGQCVDYWCIWCHEKQALENTRNALKLRRKIENNVRGWIILLNARAREIPLCTTGYVPGLLLLFRIFFFFTTNRILFIL